MPITITLFTVFLVVLLFAFRNFDKLLEIEYLKYRDEWVKDGKPRGFFFWRPPESCEYFSSAVAQQVLSVKWIFKPPGWSLKDIEAKTHQRNFRLFVLISWIVIVVLFVITLVRG